MEILIRTAKLFFGIAYFFMKCGRVENKVVFVSRQRNDPSEDFKALAASLAAAGVVSEMHLHRQEKDNSRFLSEARANLRVILRQMRAIAKARVVVTDGYSIPVSILKHRKELTVIQLWHAIGAVKKFGLQTVPAMSDAERKRAKLLRMHEGYDYFVAPSAMTARFFAGAFGMSADKALVTGTPFLDALRAGSYDRSAEIAGAYPEPAKNDAAVRPAKVVLYVPTYRTGRAAVGDAADKAGEYNNDSVAEERGGVRPRCLSGKEADALRSALEQAGCIVLDHRHPVEGAVADAGADADPFAGGFSAEELMSAADAVVTDYSSLAITAALLGKPLYFYLYDIDEYRRSPGLNIDPETEYGRYAARDAEQLARLITEEDYDAAYERAFVEKYIETYDGACTERLTDAILQCCGARNDVETPRR
jgi:CDP-ribitol ribitolphosphotransferase